MFEKVCSFHQLLSSIMDGRLTLLTIELCLLHKKQQVLKDWIVKFKGMNFKKNDDEQDTIKVCLSLLINDTIKD